MKTSSLYIYNATIYTEDGIKNGSLQIEDGQIKQLLPTTAGCPENVDVVDGTGLNVIPGFIDSHIHGAAGADVMDATEEALYSISAELPKEGTTSFLATTITQSQHEITNALKNAGTYKERSGHATMLGVHLEGPFIEKDQAGAQPVQHIVPPHLDQFHYWQEVANDQIRTITIAPEHDEDGLFTRTLTQAGVNVSAGHTNAGFADMQQAVMNGVSQVTHLCNAMTGIHHRDIGCVGAAFQLQELQAELIADGIHVNNEMLQIIYDHMGSDRIILITDAMRAKGLQSGRYELGGQPVIVTEDRAMLESGALAGSILKMDEGARNMLSLEGVTIRDIIQMASVNPAKQLGVFDRKGSIAPNKDADILIVDNQLHIQYTICNGVIAYRGENEHGNY